MSPQFNPSPFRSWFWPRINVAPPTLASNTVVSVKLWLDLADASQQLPQHSILVTAVTGLNAAHPLSRVTVHLHRTVTMGTKGLEGKKETGLS